MLLILKIMDFIQKNYILIIKTELNQQKWFH